MEAANEPVPLDSIDRESFDRLAADLRSLLNDDPAASANALRALVGSVRILKGDENQGRNAVWLAEFSLQPAEAMSIVAKRSNHPTSSTWEYLCRRSWTIDCPVRTTIIDRSKGALIARQVFPLASLQPTLEEIYAQTGLSILVIMALVAFYGLDGASVSYPFVPKSKQISTALYEEIGPIVVELRDRHLIPYRVIARDNHYAGATIIRAYHYQISKTRAQSKALGPAPQPFMPSNIIINRCKGIGRHYRLGTDPKLVARELGIPVQKVIRYRFVYAQIAQELDRWRRWGLQLYSYPWRRGSPQFPTGPTFTLRSTASFSTQFRASL